MQSVSLQDTYYYLDSNIICCLDQRIRTSNIQPVPASDKSRLKRVREGDVNEEVLNFIENEPRSSITRRTSASTTLQCYCLGWNFRLIGPCILPQCLHAEKFLNSLNIMLIDLLAESTLAIRRDI